MEQISCQFVHNFRTTVFNSFHFNLIGTVLLDESKEVKNETNIFVVFRESVIGGKSN